MKALLTSLRESEAGKFLKTGKVEIRVGERGN